MKNNSIRRLFAGDRKAEPEGVPYTDEPQEGAEPERGGESAAERLGRWLLDSLGAADDGVTEDELVDAIIKERSALPAPAEEEEEPLEDGTQHEGAGEEDLANSGGLPEAPRELPFKARAPRPSPIKTGSAAPAPVDYADMSAEQFRNIRRLLKKAAADGRRIKL